MATSNGVAARPFKGAGSKGQGFKSQGFKAQSFKGPKPEPKIIFQKFFKSVGPRTYAAQIKELANGNQLLVLTEGKRDEASGEVRKTRLYLFAEDFKEYFRMLHETAEFMRAHPLPEEVRKRRQKYWEKENAGTNKTPSSARQ